MTARSLRVLMTADTVGGVFTYALELARALAPQGVEVVLASMGRPTSSLQRAQVAAVPSITLCESSYLLEWADEPWDDVARAGDWLLELARRHAPDVVHLNGYAHGALPFAAPVLVVGHSCVLSWWEAVKGESAPGRYALYREKVRAGLLGADVVVAPTYTMRDALVRHYGPLGRSVVIANASDSWLFVPREKEPQILAVGRIWDEAKNLAQLAHVAPMLPWPVVIAGESEGPPGAGSAHAAQAERVTYTGQLSRTALAALMGKAAVYASPARYEPFGLSVLEAALCGAALVLGDIPSLRELWDGAALFVPPDDAGALTSTLTALTEDPALRAWLAQRARVRAGRFEPVRFGAEYVALYRELLEARAAVPRGLRTPRHDAASLLMKSPS